MDVSKPTRLLKFYEGMPFKGNEAIADINWIMLITANSESSERFLIVTQPHSFRAKIIFRVPKA